MFQQYVWLQPVIEWMSVQAAGDLKAMSHHGAVYFSSTKSYRDCGNYMYSLLYQSLLCASRDTILEDSFHKLGCKFETLSESVADSRTALWKQGDAIEILLSITRCTGPQVSPTESSARPLFAVQVKQKESSFA